MVEVQSLNVWQFIQRCLAHAIPVTLLYVVESVGSSPGRKGFIMATTPHECVGTIGGGIMEYKLVELCRAFINESDSDVRLITQYHDKTHANDQSGMICSGMQRVAIIPIRQIHEKIVETCIYVLDGKVHAQIEISPTGISVEEKSGNQDGLLYEDERSWQYRETIGIQPRLHIIGAGHVSLALSDLMSRLGFYVIIYDDRPDLNTLQNNVSASEKRIVDYDFIGTQIYSNPEEYIVVMTIGYRSDKVILQQLIDKPYRYLGMLGSEAKVKRLFEEFRAEGWTESQLAQIHAPIGLKIFSQTADEIAVSIAAEIIREKNSHRNDPS